MSMTVVSQEIAVSLVNTYATTCSTRFKLQKSELYLYEITNTCLFYIDLDSKGSSTYNTDFRPNLCACETLSHGKKCTTLGIGVESKPFG